MMLIKKAFLVNVHSNQKIAKTSFQRQEFVRKSYSKQHMSVKMCSVHYITSQTSQAL